MNVKRTREILGDEVGNLTNDEILILIQDRSRLCDVLIDLFEAEVLTDEINKNKNAVK